MSRIKPLLPTLREKKRYVVFEVISKLPNSFEAVSRAIQGSILAFIGVKGAAQAGATLLKDKFDHATQEGILKVANLYINDLKGSLALTRAVGSNKVIIRVKGVSGILKKTTRFMEG